MVAKKPILLRVFGDRMKIIRWVLATLSVCVLGCIGDALPWVYLLRGEIRSAADSLVVDSVTVLRRVLSEDLDPYGRNSLDSNFVADSGLYFFDLRTSVDDDEAEAVINKARFTFRFTKEGFLPKDTTFLGGELSKLKRQHRQYKIALPVIYLETEKPYRRASHPEDAQPLMRNRFRAGRGPGP